MAPPEPSGGRLSEEEWQELSQDLLKPDDPFIQQYATRREALIAEEKKQRSGTVLDSH